MSIHLNNSTTLRLLRNEIDLALAQLGEKHGLVIHASKARYDNDGQSVTFNLDIAVKDATNAGRSPEMLRAERAWPQYCALFNLKPEWLGRTINHRGTQYAIAGIMPNRPKFPIVMRSVDEGGREVLMTAGDVRSRIVLADGVKTAADMARACLGSKAA